MALIKISSERKWSCRLSYSLTYSNIILFHKVMIVVLSTFDVDLEQRGRQLWQRSNKGSRSIQHYNTLPIHAHTPDRGTHALLAPPTHLGQSHDHATAVGGCGFRVLARGLLFRFQLLMRYTHTYTHTYIHTHTYRQTDT